MRWFAAIPPPKASPANALLLGLVFICLVEALTLYLHLQLPWTGVQLAVKAQQVIGLVSPDSPVAGQLANASALQAIETPTARIELQPLLLIEPLSIPTYAELNQYIALQAQLAQAFTGDMPVNLITAEQQRITLSIKPHTMLVQIPAFFWWFALTNIAGLLVGVVVWTYKPHTLESTCLLLACLSYYCAGSIFRLLISREFYLPPAWLKVMIPAEALAMNVFLGSLLTILCYYPRQIAAKWGMLAIAGIMLLLTLNYYFQWVAMPLHIYITPITPFIVIGTWLFYKQWQRTRGNPVDRTTVWVLQFSTLLPAWLIMLLYGFPLMFGVQPFISEVTTRALLVATFTGWAVGILRFRLFEIEYWWFRSLLWLVGGSVVLILDLVLAATFQASTAYALGGSVILAGFVYFPLRQWLFEKIMPDERQSLQAFLPVFSQSMADATSKEGFEQRWQAALQQRFRPLHIERLAEQSSAVMLADNGLHLTVPSLGNHHAYRLSGKQMAAHLFNKADRQQTESLLTIARMASVASETRQQTVLAERQRIMGDLHDSVGAQLMTLMHKLPDPEHKQAARLALTTLRDTIRLSQKTSPLRLVDQVADWRVEIAERAEAAGVELVWQQGELNGFALSAKQVLELSQVLREAVSNALRHALPEVLEIGISVKAQRLHVCIMNDGRVSLPATWRAGTGMSTMQKRVHGLGGHIQFRLTALPKAKMQVLLNVPLYATTPDR
ncbi:hypothetical protein HMY34_02960 [Thiothrix subterranea]|uniref:sensor histidine kinase n=1 Tax=Thiothrix subterranea TaxID=2735563 RepID=UPI00192AF457|nr:hypothetical protein [Thiothrix subterranea]QQZ27794.1 hypothetical protein HMY34_02960 [Thiothrix subterranea]